MQSIIADGLHKSPRPRYNPPMAFPPQFLDEIRARVPLSSLAGRKIKLQKSGREWRAPCPFHKEKTPSFYINDQKGFFHCFGCGAHGDAVGFVMRHDNLSFLEAVEALAAEAGLEVPKPTEQERQRYEAQKTQHDILEAATLWFEEELRKPSGRKALDYLYGRGLDDAAIAAFRLGYAPADAQALRTAMLARGAQEPDLIELGLLRRSEDNTRVYAFFRDRVIFPVGDRRGRPVAFGARLMEGEGPKYINSPEHALFHKGETLYGLARARLAAADGKPVIVAEGYMDVIALNRAGFTGAVAPMGTALTEPQIEELWRLIPSGVRAPILCLDGDKAGQKAAERAVERVLPILKPDHTLKIAFMPQGEDPDSLVKKGGAEAIARVLEDTIPLVEMLWRSTSGAHPGTTPEEQAGLKMDLMSRVERIGSLSVRENYARDMQRRLREASFVPWQKPEWKPGGKGKAKPAAGGKPTRRPPKPELTRFKALTAVMMNRPALATDFLDDFTLLAAGNDIPKVLVDLHRAMLHFFHTQVDFEDNELHLRLHDEGHSAALEMLLQQAVVLHSKWGQADVPHEAVKGSWRREFARAAAAIVLEEIREAALDVARDDEAAWTRMVALHAEHQKLTALADNPD
jgi:DNA primase